jgi:IS605 OrfB family transposase
MSDPTTRAYTIKLSGDDNWRQHVWRTHVAVNRGAWAWGEWLLTLRGGLPASLADEHPDGRVLLALSWLTVESPATLVSAPIIARAGDSDRANKVLRAFEEILAHQGVADAESWRVACEPTLKARIRDDAVWVNRHAAFLQLEKANPSLTAIWAEHTLFDFLGGETDYFHMPDTDATATVEAKDFVQKAGGWLSRNWGSGKKSDASSIGESLRCLSEVDETVVVGNSSLQVLKQLHIALASCPDDINSIEEALKSLKQKIGWKGRPSKGAVALGALSQAETVSSEIWGRTKQKLQEEAADQCVKAGTSGVPEWMDDWRKRMESADGIGFAYRCDRDLIWEHGVMLDHALRRVSSAHSWIKRAEVSRRQFQSEAVRNISASATDWLDQFCEDRTSETGGQQDYVIHKRALDGWEKLVRVWEELGENATPQERITAARQMQADMEEGEKLGDMTLFERLASQDARCVWQAMDGRAAPQILKDYSAAQVARHNQQRFKVPAYRHPDPLRNPIYVDFGNSRWSISYSALKASQDRPKLQQKLAKAKTEATRAKLWAQLDDAPDLRGVTLGLWTGERVENVPLRWQGKRLWRDLDLDHFDQPGEATVTRADRLGRAMQDVPQGGVAVAEVFRAQDWNGRLQAPREQLDRLADLLYGKTGDVRNDADYGKLERLSSLPQAVRQFGHLRWFLTTSAKLKPAGPWWKLVEAGLPAGIEYKKGRSGYYLNYQVNSDRKGRARLHLAGISGLRVLSFDMGHRYGASCAVWETLSRESLQAEIASHDVISGSLDDSALYLHTLRHDERGKPRRTIYRRTATDMWARLDRQFVIRLQGEDRAARWAIAEEMAGFTAFRKFLGITSLAEFGIEKMRVDELQYEAVREARYGLRRMGDVARIAYSMSAKYKPLSGSRDSAEFTSEERITYVAEGLARWQQLARQGDGWAAEQWQRYVVDRLGAEKLSGAADDVDAVAGKRGIKKLVEAFVPVARKLVGLPGLNADLHGLWADYYRKREIEWKEHLRWLRRLILPRKGEFKQGNVGGLSVQRLQTIRGLYEVLRAFRMRPEPDDLRKNVPEPGDAALARFGRRILGKLEQLREQRIKQLASRIVEAALGAGRTQTSRGRDRKRPDTCVDKSCHVVVAENLERYLPEETRLRKENRRLMDWAARNVRKFIVEGCELNGLYFTEVSPAYTSQQDSRTGAPGIRCEDIPGQVVSAAIGGGAGSLRSLEQMRQAAWLAREIQKLPSDEKGCSPRQRILRAICNNQMSSRKNAVRVPRRGGELFVSSSASSPAAHGLQADLNAAANIGLKALMHPDHIVSWWFVLVDKESGKPVPEKLKGCPLWDNSGSAHSLLAAGKVHGVTSPKKSKQRQRTTVYAWNPLHGKTGQWKPTTEYKAEVELLIAQKLLQQLELAEAPW